MSRGGVSSRAGGFTLLEVMVATAILAIGLSVVSGGFGMTARSTALAAGYERARQLAETRLALFLAARPQRSERIEGVDDGLRWRLWAEPDPDQEGLLIVSIEVRFFAAGERTLTLETREVSRALPEPDEPDAATEPAGARS